MICARALDWPAILAHRFARDGDEPAGYADALTHAEECADCRRRALRLDPSLLFGVVAERERRHQDSAGDADAEIDRMQSAVANLRRLRRIEDGLPRERRAKWRWTAAAGFFFAVLSLGPSTMAPRAGSLAGGEAAQQPPDVAVSAASAAAQQWSMAPVVEPLGGEARVYELDSASDLAVVLIVDQTIDV